MFGILNDFPLGKCFKRLHLKFNSAHFGDICSNRKLIFENGLYRKWKPKIEIWINIPRFKAICNRSPLGHCPIRCQFRKINTLVLQDQLEMWGVNFFVAWLLKMKILKFISIQLSVKKTLSTLVLVTIYRFYVTNMWGNGCSARVTSARNNYGTNLWTSAPNVNFGTGFHWNVNFGINYKLTWADVNEIFRNLCRSSPVPKFGYPPICRMLMTTSVTKKDVEEKFVWRSRK